MVNCREKWLAFFVLCMCKWDCELVCNMVICGRYNYLIKWRN
jgi:hypothetical protein